MVDKREARALDEIFDCLEKITGKKMHFVNLEKITSCKRKKTPILEVLLRR